MLGALVGDVIGSAFEMSPIKSTHFPLFASGSECTDDSILTVATAHALLTDGDFAAAYQDYFHRYPNAPYGSRFVVWANRRKSHPYNSWGNGSAMRVSPIAWAFNDLSTVLEYAEISSAVTHNHPEAIRAAQAVAGCIFLARTHHDRNQIAHFVRAGVGYPLSTSLDDLRPDYAFDPTALGTAPPAIQAFLESTSFEHALRLAVSLGGDSDTLAAITGSIAHAFYGPIPDHLLRPTLTTYLPTSLLKTTTEFCQTFNIPIEAPAP